MTAFTLNWIALVAELVIPRAVAYHFRINRTLDDFISLLELYRINNENHISDSTTIS
jgi:hypothetical protein